MKNMETKTWIRKLHYASLHSVQRPSAPRLQGCLPPRLPDQVNYFGTTGPLMFCFRVFFQAPSIFALVRVLRRLHPWQSFKIDLINLIY